MHATSSARPVLNRLRDERDILTILDAPQGRVYELALKLVGRQFQASRQSVVGNGSTLLQSSEPLGQLVPTNLFASGSGECADGGAQSTRRSPPASACSVGRR